MGTALHTSQGELARRAAVDGLTGLANRASFNERTSGGDEFAIITLATSADTTTDLVSDRVLKAFRDPFDLGGRSIPVEVSIGVSARRPSRLAFPDAFGNAMARQVTVLIAVAPTARSSRGAVWRSRGRRKRP
jgi:GGDEF domain-containing protein